MREGGGREWVQVSSVRYFFNKVIRHLLTIDCTV